MFTQRQMPLSMIVRWTKKTTKIFVLNAAIPACLHYFLDLHFLTIPWPLVALVGTAVALLISFQNNSAYDRVWEARKIWGGIVNATRTFSVFTRDMVENDRESVEKILYRHRAWLTALRFSLRTHKPWEIPEVTDPKVLEIFNQLRYNPERVESFEESLKPLLSETEYKSVLAAPNRPAAILALQSEHLSQLKRDNKIWEFSYLKLEDLIQEFYTLQGKSERIKNFPYPRQYFTLGVHLTWAFIILLPYALVPEFSEIGFLIGKTLNMDLSWFTLASVPFIVCLSWIFHTMGRMGRAGENPFEGTIHDVPISTISRTLEIEVSHILNEDENKRPKPFPAVGSVQM